MNSNTPENPNLSSRRIFAGILSIVSLLGLIVEHHRGFKEFTANSIITDAVLATIFLASIHYNFFKIDSHSK